MTHLTHPRLNIGIAGAGIMGRLLGWQLRQRGHQISLFDQDPISHGSAAAYTAAGMLTPYTEVESTEWLIYQLGMQGLKRWPEIAAELNADLDFHQAGSLIVCHPGDQSDLWRFKTQLTAKLGAQLKDELITLDKQQIAQLEPELAAQFNQGLFLPKEAWLCSQLVMQTLAKRLLASRIDWHADTQVDYVTANKISCDGRDHHFDIAIDCRGLGGRSGFSQLRGVRGELIWVDAPEVNISRMVRLMHPRYRLYLVPRQRNIYVLGATQIENEDYSPISVRSSLELLSALYSIHPGFGEARIIDTKTNCRPALFDNLPAIAKSDGLIRVNGLYRHGFLLAPVLADEVSHLVAQMTSPSTEPSTEPSLFNPLIQIKEALP